MRRRSTEPDKRRPLLARGEKLSELAARQQLGGDKFHPVSLQRAWEKLTPKAELVLAELGRMPASSRGQHVVFETTLLPNYLASSYFPEEVISRSGLYVVGSRLARETHVTKNKVRGDQPTKTLLLAGAPAQVRSFARRLTEKPTMANERAWETFRRFADVSLPSPERIIVRRPDLGAGEVITWEAVLTHIYDEPFHEHDWADENFQRWTTYVAGLGGRVDVDYRRDVEHLTFVPVELAGEALHDAARFNLLRAIRPMPELRPFPDDLLRIAPLPTKPSRAADEGRVPEITIAAFDGGVDSNLALFRPFVSTVDLTPEPPDPRAVRHGSMVTSAQLYGSIQPGQQLPDPPARVIHHRILPVPATAAGPLGVYWILDRLVERVRADGHSLVSLSIGPDEPVEDGQEPTRWTAELDALAADGVTFIVAAGNNGERDSVLGLNRVLAPGDMVNGISVGACTTSYGAAIRASYSPVGPGREGQRVAPTGVAFGGSESEPFVAIDPSGRLANTAGTSFAAPVAARGVADLWTALDQTRRTPAHSRLFAVHFASRAARGHRLLELGHGRLPSDYAAFFECPPNEVTVLYEDDLPRSDVVAMRIPFPLGLAPDTEIRAEWTMSFVASVDPRDPCDYALQGLEVTFRPHDGRRTLSNPADKSDTRIVDMEREAAEIRRDLAAGYRLSEPKAHSGWRPKAEGDQRSSGKWDTLVRGRVKLPSQDLFRPRMDVLHLRRADGHLISGDAVPPLRFTMLLTIKAPIGVEIYDRVASQFPILVPVVQIPARVSGVA
jgi:hypothetical protein